MSFEGPDFIGIGMERAGTSWLFTQLASHPDIWVPPLKELHFFDVIDPKARYLKHRYRYHLPSRLKQKVAPFIRSLRARRPEFFKNSWLRYWQWDFRFFVGRFGLDWYVRLFDGCFTKGRVSGEITPAYSNLTPATIATILEMNRDVKFILIVRDPAQRMWSGLVHHFCHVEGRDFESVTEDEMIAFLENSPASDRSDAVSILETWQGEVPDEQLMIQPFERIADDPEGLLEEVYEFLGVEAGFLPPEDIYKRKVNDYTRQSYEMPPRVQDYLRAMQTTS